MQALQKAGKQDDAEDYLDRQYVKTFRVSKPLFDAIYTDTHALWEKSDTAFRCAVSSEKRLAMLLYWLAHATTQDELANLFGVGQSTVHGILHDGVDTLAVHLGKKSIVFPKGEDLKRVISGFKRICKLPMCAGAIDGTFMKIIKPSVWGDSYWCYKSYPAIIILAVVDADGIFTYVDVGRAGSLGDAYTFNNSSLKRKLQTRSWLQSTTKLISGHRIKPYLLADSAFGASEHVVKAYKHPPQPGQQATFNSAVNKGRKVVEQAFGRLKGRFAVLTRSFVRDPEFAARVALLCSALHNMCTRGNVEFFDSWLPDRAEYTGDGEQAADANNGAGGSAEVVRKALTTYIHMLR
ncbi:uncharacterized protein LOC135805424 [Sycon ciliatum]|uniref:uncharacterized protein LOC135805424 n=1 Tax=Sycon ciliatum TaxID=27933 RepID=UPI0031F61733